MANYIAIIELRDTETEEDFEQLDAAMEERQFLPQIRDDDSKVYWLLTGSYAIQSTDMGNFGGILPDFREFIAQGIATAEILELAERSIDFGTSRVPATFLSV